MMPKKRPGKANNRKGFGHFEVDTIFSCVGSKSVLFVLVDRLTRKIHIKKLERKEASITSFSIVTVLSEYNVFHSQILVLVFGTTISGKLRL